MSGKIYRASEAYAPIRIKNSKCNLSEFLNNSIEYVEIRTCDINPFDKCGVAKEEMDLAVLLLLECLIDNESEYIDYQETAETGLSDSQMKIIENEIEKLDDINNKLKLNLDDGINFIKEVYSSENNYAERVKKLGNNLLEEILKLSKEHSKSASDFYYLSEGYPEIQQSAALVMKDAITQGVDFNVIDEKRSFIEYNNNGVTECIIEATRTSADNYIFEYITNDKVYAKKIMIKNNVSTPDFCVLNYKMSSHEIENILSEYEGKSIVIKPKSSNYGDGISIYKDSTNLETLITAVKRAFKFDSEVIIEQYVQGKEYRFLVIDGKCISVVWRRNASVIGDGEHTIKELIKIREMSPRYVKTKKIIPINELMIEYLNEQKLTLDSIPNANERVWLQKMSNVSKGGECVAVTDEMPEKFKKVAEKLATAFKAKICGVDIVIDDITKDEYYVLEINDNPGIFINEKPFEGNGVKVGIYILKLLKLIK